VDFAGDAEVLRITLKGGDPRETAVLVNAIAEHYIYVDPSMKGRMVTEAAVERRHCGFATLEEVNGQFGDFIPLDLQLPDHELPRYLVAAPPFSCELDPRRRGTEGIALGVEILADFQISSLRRAEADLPAERAADGDVNASIIAPEYLISASNTCPTRTTL
jgi:hypothetical protein